jgi:acylphosphatase
MAQLKAKRWLVAGRVQGVGFRYFTEKKGNALGVDGWVRNLDDGRVEAFAMGTDGQLKEFAAALYKGPVGADVRHVEELLDAPVNLSGFHVR